MQHVIITTSSVMPEKLLKVQYQIFSLGVTGSGEYMYMSIHPFNVV